MVRLLLILALCACSENQLEGSQNPVGGPGSDQGAQDTSADTGDTSASGTNTDTGSVTGTTGGGIDTSGGAGHTGGGTDTGGSTGSDTGSTGSDTGLPPPPDTGDTQALCMYASHVAGYLDQFQVPGDGQVFFCHNDGGPHWNYLHTSNDACLTHITHLADVFPTTICDS